MGCLQDQDDPHNAGKSDRSACLSVVRLQLRLYADHWHRICPNHRAVMLKWWTICCNRDKSCIALCAAIRALSRAHQHASLALLKKYSGMQLKLKGVMHQLQALLWYRVIELEWGQWHGAATSCLLAAETATSCSVMCERRKTTSTS